MEARTDAKLSLSDQAERLHILSEISRVLASTLDLHALYDTIYRQISRVMDATLLSLAIHDPGSTVVRLPYIREMGHLLTDQEVPYGGNVTSLVIDRGTPLLFHSGDDYARYVAENGLPQLNVGEQEDEEGMIFVPLGTGSATIGCLGVGSLHRNAYTAEDVETLTIIAAQAAVAIENARLFARNQEAVREMHALLDMARAVSSSLDLGDVLEAILTRAREVVPFVYAAIILPDEDGMLAIVGSLGPAGTAVARTRESALRFPGDRGISGHVLSTGEPLLVGDTRLFPGWVPSSIEGVYSEIAVPLIQDRAIGVLNAGREGTNAFAPHELDIMSLFAAQAAIAIENARLYTEQQQRVNELQTIQTIARSIAPLQDMAAITDTVNARLKSLIDFHTCRLFVLDDDDMLMPLTHGQHEVRLPLSAGFTGWIAQHGKSLLIDDVLRDPRAQYIPGTPVRPESLIGAPLVTDGHVNGVITLTKLGVRQFDVNALRVLEIVAAQIAIAFERARLYDQLRAEAITDSLTGLYNRRYLQERYLQESARAQRNGHPLAAIMLDIDRFKSINDRWGHDAGDVVLRDLAGVIRREVRAEDVVARYGGEEFCILLPHSPVADAEGVARRICRCVEEHPWPPEAHADRVTVSIGVAGSEPGTGGGTATELISAADLAMYRAKRSGGNRVCLAG